MSIRVPVLSGIGRGKHVLWDGWAGFLLRGARIRAHAVISRVAAELCIQIAAQHRFGTDDPHRSPQCCLRATMTGFGAAPLTPVVVGPIWERACGAHEDQFCGDRQALRDLSSAQPDQPGRLCLGSDGLRPGRGRVCAGTARPGKDERQDRAPLAV
jgi:hypothetical protein